MVAPSTREMMDAYALTASMCGISTRTVLAPQLEHLHGGVEGRPHLRIGAVEEEVGGNANPHPTYVSVERSFVVRDRLSRGRRIGRIMASDGAKQPRAIAGCPRKRPDVVRGEAKRHGAVARYARLRALDAGYAAHGRRQPDGAAGVRAERPIDEAGGDRRARPRRGAARAIVDMPGVVAVAEMRIVASRVLCELRHIERPDGDRPGVLEPLDRRCRIGRPECAANLGATPARLARPVVHVLVRERHAVQGAEQRAGLALPVEALGGLQCLLRLEGNTRVDRPVAGLEGVKRGFGEGDRSNLALAHRLARLD